MCYTGVWRCVCWLRLQWQWKQWPVEHEGQWQRWQWLQRQWLWYQWRRRKETFQHLSAQKEKWVFPHIVLNLENFTTAEKKVISAKMTTMTNGRNVISASTICHLYLSLSHQAHPAVLTPYQGSVKAPTVQYHHRAWKPPERTHTPSASLPSRSSVTIMVSHRLGRTVVTAQTGQNHRTTCTASPGRRPYLTTSPNSFQTLVWTPQKSRRKVQSLWQ